MDNGFRSLHPFVIFLYYVLAIAMIMLYQHPFFLTFACLLLVIFNFVLDQGKMLKKWVSMMIVLSLLFLILTPLTNHRGSHILFYLFNSAITLEALVQGLLNALTLIVILTLTITFNYCMTSDKFLFLFSKWMPKWSLLVMLSVRFVPLLNRRLMEITTVQKGKGLSVASGPLKQRVKHGLLLVQVLLTWSLEDGIQTADSMSARAYGLQKRTKYTPYKLHMNDGFMILILAGLTGTGIFGWWLGDGVLTLTPFLEPTILYGREWVFFTIYVLIIGFPLIVEGKEAIQWQYWKR